jgi:hypothetical protein
MQATEQYQKLESEADAIAKAIEAFEVSVLESEIPQEVKLKIFEWNQGYRSLAYFLHPQSEWTGGESFRVNLPHIAKQQESV